MSTENARATYIFDRLNFSGGPFRHPGVRADGPARGQAAGRTAPERGADTRVLAKKVTKNAIFENGKFLLLFVTKNADMSKKGGNEPGTRRPDPLRPNGSGPFSEHVTEFWKT